MSDEKNIPLDLDKTRDFLESLLHPERFGYAVTEEVRDAARGLLGIRKVRQA